MDRWVLEKHTLLKGLFGIGQMKKKIAIVCSTGIASTHYGDLEATTLHKWAEIEDGKHVTEELAHLVLTDERFLKVKQNIQVTELVIIDEISMISAKTFNQLEILCEMLETIMNISEGCT